MFRRNKRSSSENKQISRITSFNDGSSLQTPKIVIKALYDYQPQGPDELMFKKGDFFHVMVEPTETADSNGWYEATNPMTNAKGMVPMSYFEVLHRTRPETAVAGDDVLNAQKKQNGTPRNSSRNSSQTLYAVVLYEFKAEREDELDIIPGENLIICAHHDFEWFIAKPINRLGGPGLVPVSYVKIIDLINPTNVINNDEQDLVKIINNFKIPSVEQWKDITAKYQASTIPLGSISNQAMVNSSNTQFFSQNEGTISNRSSLSSSNTSIIEASVDSYQLDHGRYHYLIVAKLSNGKVRYLYRYYQDFYDLQVKLLELFPYEAGKIENSKRIIPSIPGPLINVNDSISKLRREKLDYYLRNLIGLPAHISRSEEVLKLFEILDNGFDKEVADTNKQRQLKPISQKSNYQQDRLSQYSTMQNMKSTPTSSESISMNQAQPSSQPLQQSQAQSTVASSVTAGPGPTQTTTQSDSDKSKVKVKFYYQDDIFVLLLPSGLRLNDLKTKLFKRLNLNEASSEFNPELIRIYVKNDLEDYQLEHGLKGYTYTNDQLLKMKSIEINNDTKFHEILYDKCKLVILA